MVTQTKYLQSNQKFVFFTMGLPGAGKSTVIQRDFTAIAQQAIVIDPDAIMAELPEYDVREPAKFHKYGSEQAKIRYAKALETQQKFIFYDGTGCSVDKMLKLIADAQANNYVTVLLYVRVTLQTSILRNSLRERHVPEEVIREKASLLAFAFEALGAKVEEIVVIDND